MRNFLTALMLGLPSLALSAPGYLYECDMHDIERARGWVSPKIAIILPATGGVTIVDALTMTFASEPVQGTVLRDNDRRLIVKWTLRNVRADSGRSFANFDYRVSIAKSSGQMELTAGPRTFDAGLRGVGTCIKRSQ
ncbi:hypothetical protein HKX54_02535 [Sulfitobacter sp. M57]|uniref:hypothetical protein n=1 Tax=unclassified Sulfitobacter TaxID=196795 RepID=UPI0023E29AE3|nr:MULTISPECIES: hypothetical protein [unclassified Sulfitobacter]MDF3413321.1 hypothetical protein [Sulfitobacter sp. KE5]MDF3421399.1 hypothetical protein [Sulfitobacter sp. KE43]MDF3431868.1 hypothetical protein [Sulfitobacter sp. KE42]MDF3457508.1 hypothetical protein [Sulfitobacter sp. S74]MDF3461410.1 hypothetical protein [Sulfitobacter sp. Ks18]